MSRTGLNWLTHPFTLSPLWENSVDEPIWERGIKNSPETQHFPIPNFFVTATPWLGILTSDSSNSNLAFVIHMQCLPIRGTYDRKSSTPDENQRERKDETDLMCDILLNQRSCIRVKKLLRRETYVCTSIEAFSTVSSMK